MSDTFVKELFEIRSLLTNCAAQGMVNGIAYTELLKLLDDLMRKYKE